MLEIIFYIIESNILDLDSRNCLKALYRYLKCIQRASEIDDQTLFRFVSPRMNDRFVETPFQNLIFFCLEILRIIVIYEQFFVNEYCNKF